ncbi:MAG: hypothetical protein U9N63_12245, partial [Pseudomonadota bacterium]|nr:hypothetical protein [Pseudomonadota bacterium]
ERAKQLSVEELRELPQIKKALLEGKEQAALYGEELEAKYGNLRLKKFVVAALGFERVCFEEVE